MNPLPRLGLLLLAIGLSGCVHLASPSDSPSSGQPPQDSNLPALKDVMTATFSSLEMFAHDHTLSYPDSLEEIVPKYLDALPRDPRNGQPLRYSKTDRGYRLGAAADYQAHGAAAGYPQMDQDGFFALQPYDFPAEP